MHIKIILCCSCVVKFPPAIFAVMPYCCKVNTTGFVILLQLLRELEFDDNIIITQVKASNLLLFIKFTSTLATI